MPYSGLKPRTVYYVKVKAVGPNGTSETALVTFTSPSIPPPPPPPSGGGGGGGSSGGVLRVVGWRLDNALAVLGYRASKREASNCGSYGMEGGALGIRDESNWKVVYQDGYTLYACKYR